MNPSRIAAALLTLTCTCVATRADTPAEQARGLLGKGHEREAFLKYLSYPGGEHAAVTLARPKADKFLSLLREHAKAIPLPRFKLVEGDLLLALGQKKEALDCYRAAAARAATKPGDGWDKGLIPADYYFVEPPPPSRDGSGGHFYREELRPLTAGPGSHRDNWLVRRFLALEAWDDAAKELARVWQIHRDNASPFVAKVQEVGQDGKPVERDRVVRPSGLDPHGLEFALDYAFFFRQRKQADRGHAVLFEALRTIDLDGPPGRDVIGQEVAAGQDPYPRRRAVRHHYDGHYARNGRPEGTTHREFIRLAFGEFKSAGREADLVADLSKHIDAGHNAARRTLARIRVHQGDGAAALPLELAYLDRTNLPGPVALRRRADLYMEHQRLAEAATAYEKLLAQPAHAAEALEPLFKIYVARGRTDDLLRLTLRQFEVVPGRLGNLGLLQQASERFRAASEMRQFVFWLQKQLAATKDPWARANLSWMLGDHDAALEALIEEVKTRGRHAGSVLNQWRGNFEALGKKRLHDFLKAYVQAEPDYLPGQWELLVLNGETDGAAAVRLLERILNAKENQRPQELSDPFLVAYRLMRLYERFRLNGELVRLGTRLIDARPPFEAAGKDLLLSGRDYNWESRLQVDHFRDCLAVLLPYLKVETKEMKLLLGKMGDYYTPFKNQAALRFHGKQARRIDPDEAHRKSADGVTVRTVGLPKNVRVLACRDDVNAVSADGEWVGTSWGLVRYRYGKDGALDVLQLPLGAPVSAITPTPAGLFAITRRGLLRIDGAGGDNPTPVRIPVEEATPGEARWYGYSSGLLWWRGRLWVEDSGRAFSYVPATGEVRCHQNADGLFMAGDHLWSAKGPFDDRLEDFRIIQTEHQLFRCVGGNTHEVWADVYINDKERYRPAVVDRKTLAVKVLPLDGVPHGEPFMVNGEIRPIADEGGRVWLWGSGFLMLYERATGKVQLVPQLDPKQVPGHKGPSCRREAVGPFYFDVLSGAPKGAPAKLLLPTASPWQIAKLADGTILLGQQRYDFRDQGGLYALTPAGKFARLGTPREQIGRNPVYKVVIDAPEKRAYVCTGTGLALLSLPKLELVGRWTEADGLPTDRVKDAVRIGRKLYLTCPPDHHSTGRYGGVGVRDLDTGLTQRLSTADGLHSPWVEALRAEGAKLHVLYGHHRDMPRERGPALVELKGDEWDARFTFKCSIFDTDKRQMRTGEETLPVPKRLSPVEETNAPKLPFLGGNLTTEVAHDGKIVLGGQYGLVIVDAPLVPPQADFPREAVKVVATARQRLQEAAAARKVAFGNAGELAKILNDDNPFVRERAAAECLRISADDSAPYVGVLAKALGDEFAPARRAAVRALAHWGTPTAAKLLTGALDDADPETRELATLALAKSGARLAPRHIEGLLKSRRTSPEDAYRALAQHATAETFAAFLKYPLTDDDYTPRREAFRLMGKALRQRPEAAAVLLRAQDDPEARRAETQLAWGVFREAGGPALPQYLEGLKSKDRVVRSNAARACGLCGDRTTIPDLRKALDLESGLSRASIVWALGELKAKEALPDLQNLYLDAATDEEGGGFRGSQAQAVYHGQYAQLRDMDALKAEWRDLSSPPRPAVADPRRYERLLTRARILDAVRKIGAEHSQEFCRVLAGSSDADARREGAEGLGAGAADREQNVKVLRGLLADDNHDVRITAAVSLLRLGDTSAEATIQDYLKANPREQVLQRLRAIASDERLDESARQTAARLLKR